MATERFEYPTHADDGSNTWQDTMQHAMDDPLATAEQCVAEHPAASVGAALAGGFLAGLVVAGMVSDMTRSRRRRSYVDRAGDQFNQATNRAGNVLQDVGQTVRDAVYDAMPNDLLARFR